MGVLASTCAPGESGGAPEVINGVKVPPTEPACAIGAANAPATNTQPSNLFNDF